MTLNRLFRGVAAVMVLTVLVGCAGGRAPAGPADEFPAAGAADSAPLTAPLPQEAPKAPPVQRDVVKTATMTVTVGDPTAAADRAADIATDAGGRVDSRTEDRGSALNRARVTLSLRVPADELDGAIDRLKQLGTVETLDLQTEDVTSQRVDLDARIKALQTSVDRLLSIMRDARDPSALIEAENALSQRQADLDSLRAQRAALGEQIAFSTITVEVLAEQAGGPSPEKYQGFFGQVERGWDALLDTGTHLFLLVGLMLPWAAAGLVLLALLVGVIKLAKRRG